MREAGGPAGSGAQAPALPIPYSPGNANHPEPGCVRPHHVVVVWAAPSRSDVCWGYSDRPIRSRAGFLSARPCPDPIGRQSSCPRRTRLLAALLPAAGHGAALCAAESPARCGPGQATVRTNGCCVSDGATIPSTGGKGVVSRAGSSGNSPVSSERSDVIGGYLLTNDIRRIECSMLRGCPCGGMHTLRVHVGVGTHPGWVGREFGSWAGPWCGDTGSDDEQRSHM